MNRKTLFQYILLSIILLFLLVLAWWAIAGGLQQFPRAETFGQQTETIIQILCGILSLLVIFTCFWRKKWSKSVRMAWGISLVLMAGLSSFVWGPPMPLISLAFAGVALLLVWIVSWTLRRTETK